MTVAAADSGARPAGREFLQVSRRTGPLARYFYFLMTLAIVAVVAFGFSFTIGKNLIHPAVPRPAVLYVHAAVFSAWLVFFVAQSALVRAHKVAWHRRAGWFGAVLGALIPVVGTVTAVTMARFNRDHLRAGHVEADLLIPLFDMLAFSSAFGLAIYWRKRPEFHRRLVLIATCALTAAAFGRFPAYLLNPAFFYAGVDLLIALGAARDWLVERKVHPVYLWTLPAFAAGQAAVMYTSLHDLPYWLRIAHAILD